MMFIKKQYYELKYYITFVNNNYYNSYIFIPSINCSNLFKYLNFNKNLNIYFIKLKNKFIHYIFKDKLNLGGNVYLCSSNNFQKIFFFLENLKKECTSFFIFKFMYNHVIFNFEKVSKFLIKSKTKDTFFFLMLNQLNGSNYKIVKFLNSIFIKLFFLLKHYGTIKSNIS